MKKYYILLLSATLLALISACTSANCPLDNFVACKLQFYDANGVKANLEAYLTVTTLKQGSHKVYIHEKLGATSIVRDTIDHALVDTAFYSVREATWRNDTILQNMLSGPSEFTLPMSYYNDCDTFVFKYSNINAVDTLYVGHSSFTRVENPECGAYRYHHITSLRSTSNGFDRVEVSKTLVDYLKEENIKIYLYETGE